MHQLPTWPGTMHTMVPLIYRYLIVELAIGMSKIQSLFSSKHMTKLVGMGYSQKIVFERNFSNIAVRAEK